MSLHTRSEKTLTLWFCRCAAPLCMCAPLVKWTASTCKGFMSVYQPVQDFTGKNARVGAEGNESLTRTVGLAVSLCQSAIREPCQLYTNTESLKCNDFPQATSASP